MGQELEPTKRGERSLELQLGALGGFDLRPTRLFVWKGDERESQARIVSLGFPPGDAGQRGARRVRSRRAPFASARAAIRS